MTNRTCSIEGCERPVVGRGWCRRHYLRWYKTGDPLKVRNLTTDPVDRFWAKVEKRGPDECWVWVGGLNATGYGRLNVGSNRSNANVVLAHRYSWELHNGPIPDGLFVCHRCDNPPCCNPSHLFVGTHDDNMADMVRKGRHWRSGQTHCKRGHEFTPENTRDNHGNRGCRECRNAAERERHARMKERRDGGLPRGASASP